MANYKPYAVNALRFGSLTRYLSVSTKIKILYFKINAGTAPKSLFDMEDNLVYTVPAGKTFNAIGLVLAQAATNDLQINEGATQDAETTLKIDVKTPNGSESYSVPLNFTFAAGKYITVDSEDANIYTVYLYGYET